LLRLTNAAIGLGWNKPFVLLQCNHIIWDSFVYKRFYNQEFMYVMNDQCRIFVMVKFGGVFGVQNKVYKIICVHEVMIHEEHT